MLYNYISIINDNYNNESTSSPRSTIECSGKYLKALERSYFGKEHQYAPVIAWRNQLCRWKEKNIHPVSLRGEKTSPQCRCEEYKTDALRIRFVRRSNPPSTLPSVSLRGARKRVPFSFSATKQSPRHIRSITFRYLRLPDTLCLRNPPPASLTITHTDE